MRAGEIRALARRAGIAPGVSVLDLCCGVAGPGRFITRELGCTYLGVDLSAERHRDRARARRRPALSLRGLADPPDPSRPVRRGAPARDACSPFPTRSRCCEEISGALATGGRFAFTLEEGLPLTEAERSEHARRRHGLAHPARGDARLPGAGRAGRPLAGGLQPVPPCRGGCADRARSPPMRRTSPRRSDSRALEELLAAHRLWSDWLRDGRVRKFAFVAEKMGALPAGVATRPDVCATSMRSPRHDG